MRIIQRILIGIVSLLFLLSAGEKLTNNAQMVALFHTLNLDTFLHGCGLIEIIIVITLLWRPTRIISTLLASAYLGGAIALMFSIGDTAIFPGLTLLMVWAIAKINLWIAWKHGYGCTCERCAPGTPATHS